ncbi:GNAT family N-acetyltransferase [Mucilaginibacter arboris]|uniref:GNAT family N-acetyltransferase n=1 Tax=Mucilaginibacter arboris TaxID=2682090 RepID=A0A7K1SS35_9SPHI|nr:GNAT family protein [Mucilaginibacter arboris]MVN20111.1 GNAT family N-acetyltransferase [Mucilaginibacter arboris]
MILKGFSFEIRPYKKGDEVSLQKYADDPKVEAYLDNRFPSPYTLADADFWITLQTKQPEPQTNAALIIGEEVVGGIGVDLQNGIYCKNAKIGYWLGSPFWGKGIMAEALALFTTYIFDRFAIERIYAGVFASNQASAKVLQKAGYQHEATFKKSLYKNGLYDDELIFSRRRPV